LKKKTFGYCGRHVEHRREIEIPLKLCHIRHSAIQNKPALILRPGHGNLEWHNQVWDPPSFDIPFYKELSLFEREQRFGNPS